MKPYSLLPFLLFAAAACGSISQPEAEGTESLIHTVDGSLPADSLGLTLIHEHVFLDWSGADSIRPEDWKRDSAFAVILPYLQEVKRLGVKSILECTPSYLGRDPVLLKRLSEASGLQFLTNTGYYGAAGDKYLPAHAFQESAAQLAQRWIQEYQNGIGSTNVKPGFIKIGVDGDSLLSEVDAKLVEAAALTHLETGLTIVAHTGPDAPALAEAEIIEKAGVSLRAWVWTHAQGGTPEVHLALARRGAWISLDGMGWVAPADQQGDSTAFKRYIELLVNLREHQLLDRVLVSHDSGWYSHGEPGGGRFMPYTNLFQLIIPELKKQGFSDRDIQQLLVDNPKEAFAIRVRRKS